MIKPTIGRVMWFWPHKIKRKDQPEPAIVCWVHGDNMVNLVAFDEDGGMNAEHSVPIVQDGSPYIVGDSPYCEWMPYQIGQAKKHEAEDATKG